MSHAAYYIIYCVNTQINYLQQKMQKIKPYRHGRIRFVALFLASMLMFGNQYAFNNPQALEESFLQDLNIGETQFNLLYTIFAFPNIFTTLILGVLIDFLGVRIGVISLSIGVALAQLVVAFGGQYYSYNTLLIGRMLFGIASESLITAQASIMAFWFKGKELATALGIILTFPELGNALNSYLTPIMYEHTNSLGAPLFLSVGFCVLSVICGVILVYIDMKADKVDKLNEDYLVEYRTHGHGEHHGQQVKCSDIKQLPGTFWVILLLCMFALSLYIPFMDNANRMFQKRFCFTQVGAGKAVMLTYLICVIVSAPIGIAVDKIGKRRYWIVGTTFVYFCAHFIFLVYPSCTGIIEKGSISGLVLIGVGYALYSNCLVPVIPIIVKESITGTAFGLMAMVQSVALATFPLISSELVGSQADAQIGFRYSSLFFTSMASLGLVTSLSLFLLDKKLKKKLDSVKYEQVTTTDGMASSEENATNAGRRSSMSSLHENLIMRSGSEAEMSSLYKDKHQLEL